MPRKATATAVVAPDPIDTHLDHASPEARLIPLDQIYLHPLNPRQEPPAAAIEALAQSIAALGLIQNLSGFADHQIRFRPGFEAANHQHTGIVAGGRRLRALQLLAARGEWAGPVPVQVTTDPALATQWAGAENETQRELPVADRIVAYRTMHRAGHTQEDIASAFGTPLSDVRRRLALASLPDAAIDALREGRIGLDVAKALTAARTEKMQADLLQGLLKGELSPWQIRDAVVRGSVRSTDKRAVYVGLDAYHAAGGTSTPDLFAEATILHDTGLLDQLATAQGTAETERLRADEGWAWAEFVPDEIWKATQSLTRANAALVGLPPGDQDRLDALLDMDPDDLTEAEVEELEALETRAEARAWTDDDRATCGIVATIAHNGTFRLEGVFRRPGDRPPERAVAGDDDGVEIGPAAPEAAMPQNLRDDLRRIRLICIQAALRPLHSTMLELLALQLSRRIDAWEQPFALDHHPGIPPERMDGMTIPAALAAPARDSGKAADILPEWTAADPVKIVDAALFDGLARAFCRTDGPFVDLIHARHPVTPRALWRPTAAGFLGRVSAGYLDTLWRDLVPDDGSRHAGFASLTKNAKAAELERLFDDMGFREALGLSRDQSARIDAWLPEELRFAAPATDETEAAA